MFRGLLDPIFAESCGDLEYNMSWEKAGKGVVGWKQRDEDAGLHEGESLAHY